MRSYILRVLAVAGILTAAFGGQVRAQDKVIYRDKDRKTVEQLGTLKGETLNDVTIKPNIGPDRKISALDVLDIYYEPKPAYKADYNKAFNGERTTLDKEKVGSVKWKSGLGNALEEYKIVLPKAAGNAPFQRHLEFKVGMLSAQIAGEDKVEMKKAAELLAAFNKKHATNWQIVSSTNRLAKLYEDLGDLEKAVGTFDELKKLPGISEDAKAELESKSVDYLLKMKKHDAAGQRLKDILARMQKTNPRYDDLEMQLLVCDANTPAKRKTAIAELQKRTTTEKDPGRKAMAFNTLGSIYMMDNDPKSAVYEFLYVDMVYPQDKAQHFRAVENLITAFRELKDMGRSKEYADKLEKMKKG